MKKKIKIQADELLTSELLAQKLDLEYGLTDEEYGDGDVEELEVEMEWSDDGDK